MVNDSQALKGRNKEQVIVAQSLAKIIVHLIFSTKNRRPLITPEVREELEGYLVGIFENLDSPSLLVGSATDHVHVLFTLSRKHALAEVVEEVKKSSSKWIKTKGQQFSDFYWQSGYGAFSVSQSMIEEVKLYVAGQERHHRSVSFQEELRAFLERHGVGYDERYVWD